MSAKPTGSTGETQGPVCTGPTVAADRMICVGFRPGAIPPAITGARNTLAFDVSFTQPGLQPHAVPSLIGSVFYLQAFSWQPGSLAASDAGQALVGPR